jgi:hypothetical protein
MQYTYFEKPNRQDQSILCSDIKCRNVQSVEKKSEREIASANLAELS